MAELFNDINPKTTIKGLGFKNENVARQSIKKVNVYFNRLKLKQKKPGWSPDNLKPRKYLKNQIEIDNYYDNQKMSRIISLYNRGKVMIPRIKNPDDMKQAVSILGEWVKNNKKGGGQEGELIPDCCHHSEKDTKCRRKKDDKVFDLPRRFDLNSCQNIRGFTMRSSCAPYMDCHRKFKK